MSGKLDPYQPPIRFFWNPDDVTKKLNGMVSNLIDGLKKTIYTTESYGRVVNGKGYLSYKENFNFLKNKNKTPWPYDVEVKLEYSNFLIFQICIESGPEVLSYWEDSVPPEYCFPDSTNSLKEAMKNKEFADNVIELVEKVFAPEFFKWTNLKLKEAYLHSGEVPQ